jgi:hypothetical protein
MSEVGDSKLNKTRIFNAGKKNMKKLMIQFSINFLNFFEKIWKFPRF